MCKTSTHTRYTLYVRYGGKYIGPRFESSTTHQASTSVNAKLRYTHRLSLTHTVTFFYVCVRVRLCIFLLATEVMYACCINYITAHSVHVCESQFLSLVGGGHETSPFTSRSSRQCHKHKQFRMRS